MKLPQFVISLILLLSFLAVPNADAGLLEASYERCVAALGKPVGSEPSKVSPATDAFIFEKNGWVITIHFWNKEAHCIVYTKVGPASLTDSEISAIKYGYSEMRSWIEFKSRKGLLIRDDKKVIIDTSSIKTITIFSAELFKEAI